MPDAALIFEDKTDRAGTHVLLIGIGDYPWLEGGANCTTDERKRLAMGMGQLGAPPKSARALADWFLDGFSNPAQELASLALIISEPAAAQYSHTRAPAPKTLPRGTISDVKKAVAAWIARTSKRRDNSLVFSFCGHGLQSGNAVLLCRDYAKSTTNRFEGAIDFEQFRIALSTQQPDTQLLFVDACRTPDADAALLGQATPGDALLSLESLSKRDNAPAAQSVHFATSLYTEAWGRDDEPSLFSSALLESLAGGGATQATGWWVTTSGLHSALATYLERISRDEGISQRPAAQTVQFRISKPPQVTVPVYVKSTEPAVWNEKVTIEARRNSNAVQQICHTPPAGPDYECALRLTSATQASDMIYDLCAHFDATSTFVDCTQMIIAFPPELTCDLQVSKRP